MALLVPVKQKKKEEKCEDLTLEPDVVMCFGSSEEETEHAKDEDKENEEDNDDEEEEKEDEDETDYAQEKKRRLKEEKIAEEEEQQRIKMKTLEENVKLLAGLDSIELPMQLVKRDGQVCLIPDPRVALPGCVGNQLSIGRRKGHVKSKRTTKRRRFARLQCGVPGVMYRASEDLWLARTRKDGKECFVARFYVKRFKTDENSWLEARYEAMEAAISKIRDFCRGPNKDKKKNKKKEKQAKRKVKVAVEKKRNMKSPQRPGAEEREVADAPRGSEPPDEFQQSDCYGPGCVSWNKRDSRFEARIRLKSDGRQLSLGLFRPKDGSAKELERARQAARDAIERRRRDPNYKHMPSLDEIALCKGPPEYDADESLDMHVRCNKASTVRKKSWPRPTLRDQTAMNGRMHCLGLLGPFWDGSSKDVERAGHATGNSGKRRRDEQSLTQAENAKENVVQVNGNGPHDDADPARRDRDPQADVGSAGLDATDDDSGSDCSDCALTRRLKLAAEKVARELAARGPRRVIFSY